MAIKFLIATRSEGSRTWSKNRLVEQKELAILLSMGTYYRILARIETEGNIVSLWVPPTPQRGRCNAEIVRFSNAS